MSKTRNTEVIGMRTIKELLRLRSLGRSVNEAALGSGVARSTAQTYFKRAKEQGISYENIEGLSEKEILERLGVKQAQGRPEAAITDFHETQRELGQKGVTLYLLWEEYRKTNAQGYSYSNYCYHYRKWCGAQKLSFRQVYKAGEKMLTDYSGVTLVVYPINGTEQKAEIFVSVLGASDLVYAEATPSQNLFCWIGSHERALQYFGGVPELEIIDNLKSGVNKAHRYEPEVNRTYAEFAEHCGFAVIPARALKPRDKGKVEEAVQNVERRVLAPLRDRRFTGFEELNQAIRKLLEELNHRKMQQYNCSRWELWD